MNCTLGQLIVALKTRPQDQSVEFDFCYAEPCGLHSYRGFYDQLALDWREPTKDVSVAEVFKWLDDAVGETFEGYKGGNYRMHLMTPLWVDHPNMASSTAVVGIANCNYKTILQTEHIDV